MNNFGINLGVANQLVAGRASKNLLYDYSTCDNAGVLFVNPKRGPAFGGLPKNMQKAATPRYRFTPPRTQMQWLINEAGTPSTVLKSIKPAQYGKSSVISKRAKKLSNKAKKAKPVKNPLLKKEINKQLRNLEKNKASLNKENKKEINMLIKEMRKMVRHM